MGLKKNNILILSCILCSNVFSASSFPDSDEWRFLSVDDKQVPVVYIPALTKPKGSIILIQGSQEQRYEVPIVNALRKALPKKGWHTLGINIPKVKEIKRAFIPAEKQLSKAVLMLKNTGVKVVYVLLYGNDAGLFLTHFIKGNSRDINGIILLSASSKKRSNYHELFERISNWRMFVYDISAQYEFDSVIDDVKLRKLLFKKVKPFYRSETLIGSSSGYRNFEGVLVRWLRGWMRINANKKPILTVPLA